MIGIIMGNSMRNNLRLRIALALYIAVLLICVAGIAIAFSVLVISPEVKAASPDRSKLELFLGIILYATCFCGVGINLNSFAFQSMTREKARGNIEALLATPVTIKKLWIAKSTAVFLPGLVIGVALTLIILIALNIIYFIPVTGFIITPWIFINGFITAPLMYLCLSLLAHLIGYTGKPATANVIIQVFLPAFVSLMINLMARDILNAASWQFFLINLGIAAITGVIVILLQPRLTAEKIILSN
jgi:ABC-type transport system involved in multi-copper enzyme maturation permease subunit